MHPVARAVGMQLRGLVKSRGGRRIAIKTRGMSWGLVEPRGQRKQSKEWSGSSFAVGWMCWQSNIGLSSQDAIFQGCTLAELKQFVTHLEWQAIAKGVSEGPLDDPG